MLNENIVDHFFCDIFVRDVRIFDSFKGVLREGVGGTSPECLVRAAMCVKLVAGRAPEAVEGYRPEVRLVYLSHIVTLREKVHVPIMTWHDGHGSSLAC